MQTTLNAKLSGPICPGPVDNVRRTNRAVRSDRTIANCRKDGVPERDQTAGLLVATCETVPRCNDTERAQVTQRGSVHAALVAVRCLTLVMERHSPTQTESDGDSRVTTQSATKLHSRAGRREYAPSSKKFSQCKPSWR